MEKDRSYIPNSPGVQGHPGASSKGATSILGHLRPQGAVGVKKDDKNTSWVTLEAFQVQEKCIAALWRVWLWPDVVVCVKFGVLEAISQNACSPA